MLMCVFVRPGVDPRSSGVASRDSGLNRNGIGESMNASDLCAVEIAVRSKEAGLVNHLTVISIGDESVLPLLHLALAMGADDAIRIEIEPAVCISERAIAAVLAATPEVCACTLMVCGDESPYDRSASVVYHIAERLGRPVLSEVVGMEIKSRLVKAVRRLDKGIRETLELDMPALIAVHETIASARYVGRGVLARVGHLPVTVRRISELELRERTPQDPGQEVSFDRRPPADVFVPDLTLAALDRLERVLSGGVREARRSVAAGSATEIATALADFIEGTLAD